MRDAGLRRRHRIALPASSPAAPRWLVWREGGDRVEFVGHDWREMRCYLDERFAIEGPGEVLCFGAGVRPPGE